VPLPTEKHNFPLEELIALCQYVDMVCIYCGKDTKVINSRLQKKANSVWRRRLCVKCGGIFTTTEIFQDDNSLMLSSGDKSVVPFIRERFYLSIYDSCRHRESAVTDARHLTNTIINKLVSRHKGATIYSSDLKEMTRRTLSNFDKAAATHYRAYFMSND
jgi:transcriptional repressor NrdR